MSKKWQLDPHVYEEIKEYLREKYPQLFIKGNTKLLKVGINDEIVADEEFAYSKTALRKYLHRYTSKKEYRQQMTEGAARYGLDGEECGSVTKEELEIAARNMAAAKERALRKKQQEKPKKTWGKLGIRFNK